MRPVAGLVGNDDGSATIVAAFAIAALAAVVVSVLYVGSAVLARHHAQSAADLAALAAASSLAQAHTEPCQVARLLADAQVPPARVTACRVDGDDVQVEVAVRVEMGRFGIHDATAHARAGPAS
ncbi:flp pilus-assembly TadE/G-like family protein [Gordonia sp. ABSL1-1]|uniref:Rv3654c family TadE-like protein n=1 Tax=Gordonia sp. ABSL1-1 TaxID=3053923 RepID=UPI002573C6B7|nr:Rv3654c family TadE-like protein [Gordonia sp. ABSL1-1]MDL9937520.1 flp pilus-assembly TadE/G-like family protein [Gordonia sp. ABSL1-1]